jgi:hypothetical protein
VKQLCGVQDSEDSLAVQRATTAMCNALSYTGHCSKLAYQTTWPTCRVTLPDSNVAPIGFSVRQHTLAAGEGGGFTKEDAVGGEVVRDNTPAGDPFPGMIPLRGFLMLRFRA